MSAPRIETSVRQRAFELHVKRGGAHGHDQEDWLQAEKEVRDQFEKPSRNKQSR